MPFIWFILTRFFAGVSARCSNFLWLKYLKQYFNEKEKEKRKNNYQCNINVWQLFIYFLENSTCSLSVNFYQVLLIFLPFSLRRCDSMRLSYKKRPYYYQLFNHFQYILYQYLVLKHPLSARKANVAKKRYKNDPKFTFYILTLQESFYINQRNYLWGFVKSLKNILPATFSADVSGLIQ